MVFSINNQVGQDGPVGEQLRVVGIVVCSEKEVTIIQFVIGGVCAHVHVCGHVSVCVCLHTCMHIQRRGEHCGLCEMHKQLQIC